MDITITLDDKQVQRAFAQAPSAMDAAIEPALMRGALEVADEARKRAPKDMSTLLNSIRSMRQGPLHYVVAPAARYGRHIEEGTGKGGTPTWSTLTDWVRRKGIRPRHPGMDEHDVVFLILQKIFHRGIRAQPYMAPAAKAKRARVHLLVQEGVERGLAQVFGGAA